MPIQSPLSNISEVLSRTTEAADRYKETLRRNEAATRAVLIDPVLRALGWDTANTEMVEVEKTFEAARLDYALYDSNATVRIIIEAKQLDANLDKADLIMTLVRYAFLFKLQDIFLTDGIKWKHFTNFRPGDVRVERELDLRADPPVECAAYLVQRLDAAKYWPDQQSIDRITQQLTQLESTVASLQLEIERLRTQYEPTVLSPPDSSQVGGDTQTGAGREYVTLENLGDVTGKRPAYLRRPDGLELPVQGWKDVLRECCKFALSANPAIPIPLPDKAGRRVALFSEVKPPPGISYVVEQYNGRPVYIYVNYDANNSIANALHVLKQVDGNKQPEKVAVVLAKNP